MCIVTAFASLKSQSEATKLILTWETEQLNIPSMIYLKRPKEGFF